MAVIAERVTKAYGGATALDGVGLSVEQGEIVAVLGPNGAGKTTLLEILEGFRRRTAGRVEVLGEDPADASRTFRERVGVVLQHCEPEPYLTVAEIVELFRGYYRDPVHGGDVLALVGLTGSERSRVRTLSGGQRRRLDVALALVGGPELLFLDEPTTGFDPEARRTLWTAVRDLRDRGTTVVLTTHYLDEAEALSDRVVVLARGRVVADAPPGSLAGRNRRHAVVRVGAPDGVHAGDCPLVPRVAGDDWLFDTDSLTKTLAVLTTWALERGLDLGDLSVLRPTLEDAYLELIA